MRNKQITVLLFLFLCAPMAHAQLTDVASQLGIDVQYGESTLGGGVSFVDFDQDGWDDLTFATAEGREIMFYRNLQGVSFELVRPSFVNLTNETKHIIWVDFDNDGDLDLFISFFDGPNRLFQNHDFEFNDVTSELGLPEEDLTSLGVAWADYDRDGYVDLYVTDKRYDGNPEVSYNRMYKNGGGKGFTDRTAYAGVADSSKLPFCASFFDFNKDGWEDIYIVQDLLPFSTLLKNNRNGKFKDVAFKTGSHLPKVSGMGIAIGDLDNNGYEDLYVTNMPPGNKLLLNFGSEFREVADSMSVSFNGIGWGTNFLDFDNDMDLDLYVSGCSSEGLYPSSVLYENDAGTFIEHNLTSMVLDSYANAIGDFDNDGHPDVAVNHVDQYPASLWKSADNENDWIKFHLMGILSNRDAIGAWIELFVDGQKFTKRRTCGISFLGQNSQYLHFGLGQNDVADSVKINWPSGHVDVLYDLSAGVLHQITEGQSRPFQPEIRVIGSGAVCPGEKAQLSTGLYSSKLSYSWSTGSNRADIWVDQPGTYYATVSGEGIAASDTIVLDLEYHEAINDLNISVEDALCYGSESGRITISGSDLAYVEWSFQDTSRTLTKLPIGVYNGYVENEEGCVEEFSVEVGEPPELIVDLEQHPAFEEDHATAIVDGGTPPYSYSWNDSERSTTESILLSKYGIYVVEVTDANGCQEDAILNYSRVLGVGSDTWDRPYWYPNPVIRNEPVFFRADGIRALKVMSMNGVIILSREFDRNEHEIEMAHLRSGRYIIEVRTDDQVITQVLVVE